LVLPSSYRDWLFHPAIRAYKNPNAKAFIYRYPSPGNALNEPISDTPHLDYKTPYEHSPYDVRYTNPIPSQVAEVRYEYILDPLTSTPETK
jgi:hypothetical protein